MIKWAIIICHELAAARQSAFNYWCCQSDCTVILNYKNLLATYSLLKELAEFQRPAMMKQGFLTSRKKQKGNRCVREFAGKQIPSLKSRLRLLYWIPSLRRDLLKVMKLPFMERGICLSSLNCTIYYCFWLFHFCALRPKLPSFIHPRTPW